MPMLESRQLTVAYGDAIVLDQLDLRVPPGKITVLIGRNGCGKSTLLRALARLLKPQGGAVYLDGRAIAKLPTREVAKQLAILPQSPVAPEGLTVLGLVKQGRYPYQNWLNQWSEEDERMVRQALEWTGMVAHADRPVDALSGGNANGPGSPWPWPRERRSSFWMSQPPTSIWPTRSKSWTSWPA